MKVEKSRELALEAPAVDIDLFAGQHLTHLLRAGRIADGDRSATEERDGAVPRPLEMGQSHDRHHASHVKTRYGRVETDVAGGRAFQVLAESGLIRHLVDEAPLLEGFQDVLCHYRFIVS